MIDQEPRYLIYSNRLNLANAAGHSMLHYLFVSHRLCVARQNLVSSWWSYMQDYRVAVVFRLTALQ